MKRPRSRGRNNNNRPGNMNPNRAYESNGPDIKVRGSAQTIMEKYQQVARDAMSSGDRVLAENYLQHAEHYLRLVKAIQPNFQTRSEFAIMGLPSDFDEEVEENENSETDNENDGEESENENSEGREPRENRRYDENNRYNNNRRRGRDRYRNDRRNYSEDGAPSPSEETSDNLEVTEAVEVSNETENNSDERRAPRRNLRSRIGGTKRPRRNDDGEKSESEQGFGEELPAFLSAPVPSEAE